MVCTSARGPRADRKINGVVILRKITYGALGVDSFGPHFQAFKNLEFSGVKNRHDCGFCGENCQASSSTKKERSIRAFWRRFISKNPVEVQIGKSQFACPFEEEHDGPLPVLSGVKTPRNSRVLTPGCPFLGRF